MARVTIRLGPPGFAAVEEVLRRAAEKRGSLILSSNVALLAQVRDAAGRNERIQEAFAAGSLQIRALHEVIRLFADASEVPLATVAGPEHQAALIGQVCSELSDESPFAKARSLPGFHKALVMTLQEMRHAQIVPAEAAGAAPKLTEIAQIDEKFQSALATHRLSTLSERIEKVIATKPAKPTDLRQIYWVGETEMPPLLLAFASWLSACGVPITFLAEEHPGVERFFPVFWAMRKAFPKAELETSGVTPPTGSRLFADSVVGEGGNIRVIEFADEFVETEWAIAETARHLAAGAKAESVCIYARSLGRYGPLLEIAATRLGIPLAMVRRERIDSNRFAQQVLLGLRACLSGSMSHVANLASSAYAGISKSERDGISNEVRLCRRNAEPWQELASKAKGGAVPGWVTKFVRWRNKAITQRTTLSEWTRGLDILISGTPWLDAGTQEDHAAQDAIVRTLSVRRFAEGNREMGLREFADICAECWRDGEYSVRSQLGVRVVTTPHAIGQADFVLILGAVESQIPGRRAEDPILLDRDRAALADLNTEWSLPSSYERALEGRRDFYRLLCYAEDLTICYPLRTDESEEVRSAFLDDLKAAELSAESSVTYENRFPAPCGDVPAGLLPTSLAWHDEGDYDAGEFVAEKMRQLKDAVQAAAATTITDQEVRSQIARLPQPLRMRHVRSLRRCAFQYAASAKLGLTAKRPKWAWSSLADIVRRTNLQQRSKEALQLALLNSLADHLSEMQGSVPDEELEVVQIAAPRALAAFAEREFKSREIWKLQPVEQNVSLEDAGMHSMIPTDSGHVPFEASLDVVYRSEDGSLVPLRFSSFGTHTDDHDFADEAGLLLLLQHKSSQQSAVLDSMTSGDRKIMSRLDSTRRAQVVSKPAEGLHVDAQSESAGTRRRAAHDDLKKLLSKAAAGDATPSPGKHCSLCDYGSLCRSAPEGNLHVDPWESIDDED